MTNSSAGGGGGGGVGVIVLHAVNRDDGGATYSPSPIVE
jgi:hypothetical protein